MAITLTEDEKLGIVTVLTTPSRMVTYIEVQTQITYLGEANITAAVEARIRALLAEWTANGTNRQTDSIEPNLRNFGVRSSAEALMSKIRIEMASLLSMTDFMFGSQGWARATRG